MRELSLHILDIVQNSITAGAKNIHISIDEDTKEDTFKIVISDDGCGMDKDTLDNVNNSFASSRKSRKVGMGIAIFRAAAELADGYLTIDSSLGKGTVLTAVFRHSSVDRMPLGNMPDTMMLLIMKSPDTEFFYNHTYNGREFKFSTVEIKNILEDVRIDSPEICEYIRDYIKEHLIDLFGGNLDEIS